MTAISLHIQPLANGEALAYRKCGAGPRPLLLLHGNMTSSKHWEPLLQRLPAEYTGYAPDMRGFGASTYRRKFDSLRELAEDVQLFAEALDLPPFALAGWSLGAGVAMSFAARYPQRLRCLLLIEPLGLQGLVADDERVARARLAYELGDSQFFRELWNRLIYTHTQPPPEVYADYLAETLKQRCFPEVAEALKRFNISHQPNGLVAGSGEVARIAAPTLVINGDRDDVTPLAGAWEIAAAIGANARLRVLADSGHSPQTDQPEALARAMLDFIGAVEQGLQSP